MKKTYIKLLGVLLTLAILVGGSTLVAAAAPAAGGAPSVEEVYVGGMPFGVKFFTEGVLVVGFCDVDACSGKGEAQATQNPARDAGVRVKDLIVKVNGSPVGSAAALTEAVEKCEGHPITLTVKRLTPGGGRKAGQRGYSEVTVTVKPALSKSENRYKTGVWVRDSGAGIGTVTYIVPGTNAFAGLGHGICDGDTGELIPMQRGQVTDVTISGVERGEVGDPGAIKGYFNPGKTGTLLGNTDCGVFGIFSGLPASATTRLPVGKRQEVREGDATILCTLDNGKIGTYAVRITGVDTSATGSKCFSITVTDPALLAKTGGIVQGMSGSPVIQNGKLVGAVTHVLISDPTSGYGIFVDNMLRDMPTLLR